MKDCNPVCTPTEYGLKLTRDDQEKMIIKCYSLQEDS